MLNSMTYEDEFPDGQVKEYGVNIIAENMLTQVHEKAVALDKKNGDTFWQDILAKEMFNIGVAVEVLEEGKKAPHDCSQITGYIIFDVKMDQPRKARWVLDGHKQDDPVGTTYAGVVPRESVRIALAYAALNGLDVWTADIRDASSQKNCIICGPECGLENVGKVALIRRAIYGGKLAGKDFRNHLRSCMAFLDFTSCPADPDVWMRKAIKSDGTTHWEYVLLYTDDALVVSEKPESILRNELGKQFQLKEESIGPPKIYLGSNA
jgi:hypothetical protein